VYHIGAMSSKSLQSFFTFHTVLEVKESRAAFKSFLGLLHSAEQIDFLNAVEEIKSGTQDVTKQQELAENIVERFVKTGSTTEINVDTTMRNSCIQLLQQNVQAAKAGQPVEHYSAFRELEYQITYQLKTDMFDLFLQSDIFGQFLASIAVAKYPSVVLKNNTNTTEIVPLKLPSSTTNPPSPETPRRSSTRLFANAMKQLTESKSKRVSEPQIKVLGSSSDISENLNQIIKDLYSKLVEKDKEITVLRQQLEDHKIVPRRVNDYYHATSGSDGTIKPINSKLLPSPSSKPSSNRPRSISAMITSGNNKALPSLPLKIQTPRMSLTLPSSSSPLVHSPSVSPTSSECGSDSDENTDIGDIRIAIPQTFEEKQKSRLSNGEFKVRSRKS
jgi:hypothetical protein